VVVAFLSQLSGLILLAALLPILPSASPARTDLWWGGAAGIAGSVGVALLYRALAIGTMSIVAPTTAVCAAVIPVLLAIVLGERPGSQAVGGIVLACLAIALIGRGESSGSALRARPASAGLGLALLSGVAVGLFFFFLARTTGDAGLWPLIIGRLTSVPLFGGATLVGRHSLRMPRSVIATTIGCGTLDMLANVFYLLATRSGPLSLVATLASLYPASTVLLARVTLGERLTPGQMAGVICAIVAVVLIVGQG
jgi:drug/metabolite transporter (DMT)-like permease